jgi:hypothetical protein
MKKAMQKAFLTGVITFAAATSAVADPLDDVLNFCRNNTGVPRVEHMGITMPDAKLRGTRSPATLAAEARQAKGRGTVIPPSNG